MPDGGAQLRRLRWQDVDLKDGWLYLDASRTKAGRSDMLPIAPDVLAVLKSRGKRLGSIFRSSPTRRTFMRDIARAGIRYGTARGQADRKSLRKTLGTHLAMNGVSFQIAVRLMRHSDPRLTANLYTDPMLLDMRKAVAVLGVGSGGGA